MGYESRLYVVDKHKPYIDGELGWGETVAMFDLRKVRNLAHKLCEFPDTDCYIYDDGGDKKITHDVYGERLKEIPIPDAIRIIEGEIEVDEYRRYNACLQMLKGFDLSQWENLVVLHCGY